MAVFNGIRHLGHVPATIRTCGLIACPNDVNLCGERVNSMQPISFKTIRITGTFSTEQYTVDMPSTLRSDLTPVRDYLFCAEKLDDEKIKIIMETTSSKELLFSFGFYSRIYNTMDVYNILRFKEQNVNLSGETWIYIFMAIVGVLTVFSVIFIYVAQYTHLKLKFT